ncbi:MAG: CAP domain-containing protein [Oscillospiraceae bacterium]|nr:CAP domain-containing protein [Oscillospiraceae bacterium]
MTHKLGKVALLLAAFTLLAAPAQAAGLGITSQFGYGNVWPYRNPNPNCQPGALLPGTPGNSGNAPAPTAPPQTQPPATDGHYTIGSPSAQEREEWNYINSDRQRQGLPALPLDAALCALARIKSQDMLTNRYFAHTSPTLGNSATMLRTYGYKFSAVGENIAKYGTVAKAHAALMNSSGHRTNILGSNWAKVGVGIALDQNGFVYMTQLFVR